MTVQKMNWGRIDWFCTYEEGVPGRSMSVGICSILPKQRQNEHVHYGIEQFIYLLEGRELHIVNGREILLKKGEHIYMEAGCRHDSVNLGEQPSRELLISLPVSQSQEPLIKADERASLSGEEYPGNLYAAVEAIDAQLMGSFQAPFTIFDDKWAVVLQNDYYSPYCRQRCRTEPSAFGGRCLAKDQILSSEKDYSWFVCPHGHLVYHLPIIFRGRELGSIRGGHVVVSEISGTIGQSEVYDTPQGTAVGIRRLLRQVIKSILAYCEFDSTRAELHTKNRKLYETEDRQLDLERTLRLAEDKVTSLRINRHFLFNTLNCMADMALQKKGESLYAAILQLSRLFRRVMLPGQNKVTLGDELEYVENYLSLQKLRYGNSLLVAKSVDARLLDLPVPGNFLQPIVENAFTHGFRNSVGLMRISITVEMCAGRVLLLIRNNGQPLDDSTLLRVRNGLSSNSGHGLSLIYTKLKSAYGEGFEMDIRSEEEDGDSVTCVSLLLPPDDQGEEK
jgi:Predicted signal transduction protein with a C-terminal ATPase domain